MQYVMCDAEYVMFQTSQIIDLDSMSQGEINNNLYKYFQGFYFINLKIHLDGSCMYTVSCRQGLLCL